MKRKVVCALLLATVLGVTGCGETAGNGETSQAVSSEQPADSESSVAVESTEESVAGSTETTGEKGVDLSNMKLTTEEELLSLLAGEWQFQYEVYNPNSEVIITLKEDYTYNFHFSEGSEFEGMDYDGTFELYRYRAKEDQCPDVLSFSAGNEDRDFDQPGANPGTYEMANITVINGKLYLELERLGYDDYALSLITRSGSNMLQKLTPIQGLPQGEVVKNAEFEGLLWNIDYSMGGMKYAIANLDEENLIKPCAFYEKAPRDEDSLLDEDAYLQPEGVSNDAVFPVHVKTDEKGNITELRYYSDVNGNAVMGLTSPEEYIRGYRMEIKDYSVRDEKHILQCYTALPVFMGNDVITEELNGIFAAIAKDFEENTASNVAEEMAVLEDFEFEDTFQYSPVDTFSVYWEHDGAVSVGLLTSWYMGGVYNESYICLNYDPTTGKQLSLEEVTGKSRAEMDALVLAELDEGPDCLEYVSDYTFCFDEEHVYICFSSYELSGLGNYHGVLTFDRY